MIKPPETAEVIELPTSKLWFGEDGIVYSVSKKAPPQSLEEVKTTMENFKQLIGPRKICLLIDATHSSETPREVRNYVAEEFPKFTQAMAIVSRSALGKMLANLFFRLKAQPYPTKMFENETAAKAWLTQYL